MPDRPSKTSKVYYQNPFRGAEYIFSGDSPIDTIPNFSFEVLINHYLNYFDSFHFYLSLKNGIEVSIFRRDKNTGFVSVMQLANGSTTKYPNFEHDGFGEATVYIHKLQEFVIDLSELWARRSYVIGKETTD